VIYSAIDGVLVIILPADDILQKVPFLEFWTSQDDNDNAKISLNDYNEC
jgi:hypothetical protein